MTTEDQKRFINWNFSTSIPPARVYYDGPILTGITGSDICQIVEAGPALTSTGPLPDLPPQDSPIQAVERWLCEHRAKIRWGFQDDKWRWVERGDQTARAVTCRRRPVSGQFPGHPVLSDTHCWLPPDLEQWACENGVEVECEIEVIGGNPQFAVSKWDHRGDAWAPSLVVLLRALRYRRERDALAASIVNPDEELNALADSVLPETEEDRLRAILTTPLADQVCRSVQDRLKAEAAPKPLPNPQTVGDILGELHQIVTPPEGVRWESSRRRGVPGAELRFPAVVFTDRWGERDYYEAATLWVGADSETERYSAFLDFDGQESGTAGGDAPQDALRALVSNPIVKALLPVFGCEVNE